VNVLPGDVLTILTPGGGGYGYPDEGTEYTDDTDSNTGHLFNI
jgi:N-methylhydantoinase B/oxoprolinase/acetone carboxylase alpha subunit